MRPALPLSGIRVLDLTLIFAGPAATMILADWGAEVVRLESFAHYPETTRGPRHPNPDFVERMRASRHPYYAYVDGEPGERPWNRYAAFNAHARNKLSVDIDVASVEGREQVLELARTSDVLVENNAPALLERLRLTFDDLKSVNPQLCLVRMPGFGLSGPYRGFKANGLNMDAISGHLRTRGYPDLGPHAQGVVVTADAIASICGALGTVLALLQRKRTGHGQLVEAAMLEGFLSCLPAGVLEYSLAGVNPGPRGNASTRFAPQGVYPCAGPDEWVTLSVRTDEEWRLLCHRMDFADWLDSAEFDTTALRAANDGVISDRISDWTRRRSSIDVVSALADRFAVAPVMNEADIFADPHISAREMFGPLTQEDSGTHLYMRSWWRADGQRAPLRMPPPLFGEHALADLLANVPGVVGRQEEAG